MLVVTISITNLKIFFILICLMQCSLQVIQYKKVLIQRRIGNTLFRHDKLKKNPKKNKQHRNCCFQ